MNKKVSELEQEIKENPELYGGNKTKGSMKIILLSSFAALISVALLFGLIWMNVSDIKDRLPEQASKWAIFRITLTTDKKIYDTKIELQKKAEQLKKADESMKKTLEDLASAQKDVEKKDEQIKELETTIAQLTESEANASKTNKSVEIYEKMDPKKAGKILSTYDSALEVADILFGMKSTSAAEILKNMPEDKAVLIMQELNKRR